jgi:putative nucleotidyltransferase with HDIG domain
MTKGYGSPASAPLLPLEESLRVLVVDDDPLVLRVLQDVLRAQGCETSTAGNADRALALLDNNSYDLIVSDIRMPGPSGLDLLRAVRSRQPETPVVLITGYASVETAVEALRSGAVDYLTKPFRLQDIEKVLARVREARGQTIAIHGDGGRHHTGVLGLIQIAEATISSRDVPPVLELVLECCLNALGADGGSIQLRESEGRPPLSAHRGDPPLVERLREWGATRDRGRKTRATDEWYGLELPIEGKRGLLGQLAVARWVERGVFLPDEQELAQGFARHAALVIENLVLHASLQSNLLNTIRSFVYALEAKDKYTQGHSTRVSLYASELAKVLGVPANVAAVIRYAALLHDLGKLVIYESILKKPARLVRDEYTVMMQHPLIGEGILQPLGFLAEEARVVRHHHERYDGKGFPDGLAGEAISLPARVVTVADAFDAMSSDRPYRSAMPFETALREIRKGAGSQFDPRIAEAFADLTLHRLVEISLITPGSLDFLE